MSPILKFLGQKICRTNIKFDVHIEDKYNDKIDIRVVILNFLRQVVYIQIVSSGFTVMHTETETCILRTILIPNILKCLYVYFSF